MILARVAANDGRAHIAASAIRSQHFALQRILQISQFLLIKCKYRHNCLFFMFISDRAERKISPYSCRTRRIVCFFSGRRIVKSPVLSNDLGVRERKARQCLSVSPHDCFRLPLSFLKDTVFFADRQVQARRKSGIYQKITFLQQLFHAHLTSAKSIRCGNIGFCGKMRSAISNIPACSGT